MLTTGPLSSQVNRKTKADAMNNDQKTNLQMTDVLIIYMLDSSQ